jgi:hypothetical protein
MATQEVIRRLTLEAQTRGFGSVEAGLKTLEKAEDAVRIASQKKDKAQENSIKSFQRFLAGIDTGYRDAIKLAQGFERVELAQKKGIGTAEEHARAMQALFARTTDAKAAAEKFAEAERLGSDIARKAASEIATEQARLVRLGRELLQQSQPQIEAEKRLQDQLRATALLRRKGLISQEEQHAADAYARSIVQQSQKGIGLRADEIRNLSFQINDVISGLAMGQSPFTVLTQQGGQFYQILQGPQGVVGGLKETGKWLGSLVTPGRLAIGTLVTGAAAAAYAWNQFDDQQKALIGTLQGVGRQAGLTVNQVRALGERAAERGGLSVRQGVAGLNEAIRANPRIDTQNLARAVALTKDWAAQYTNGDVPQAQQEINALLKGGAEAVLEFDRRFNLLSVNQRRVVEDAGRYHDVNKAISTLFDALNGKMTTWKETTGQAAQAWDRIKIALSDISTSAGSVIDRMAPAAAGVVETIARGMQRVTTGDFSEHPIVKGARNLNISGGDLPSTHPRRRREWSDPDPAKMDDAARAAKNLADAMKNTQSAARALDFSLTDMTDGTTKKFDEQTKALEANKRTLQDYVKNTTSDTERANYTKQLDETDRALKSTSAAERERALNLNAMSEAQKEAAAAAEKRAAIEREESKRAEDITNKTVPQIKALKDLAAERDALLKRQNAGVKLSTDEAEALSTLNNQIESQQSSGRRVTQMDRQIEQGRLRIRNITDETIAERARTAADQVAADTRGSAMQTEQRALMIQQARNEEIVRGSVILRDAAREQRFQNQALDVEARMIFETDAARVVALATLSKEQELKRQGIDTSSAYAKRLIDEAGALAERAEANKKFKESVDFASGTASEFVKGFTSDLRQGTEAVDALTNAFGRLADRLSDRALDLAMSVITRGIGNALNSSPDMTFTPEAHTGGIIGGDYLKGRYIHRAYFDNAPRYHAGGMIGSSERPIIAKLGEGVFTPGQMRALGSGLAQTNRQPSLNVVVNNAPPGTSATQEPDGTFVVNVASAVVAKNNQSRDFARRTARPL